MSRYNRRKNRKENAIVNILAFTIVGLLGVVMLLLNGGLFFRSEDVADSSSMEIPLSHCVVDVCEDSLKVWTEGSKSIGYSSGAFSPKNKQYDSFKQIVNRNGLAERLSEYYEDYEWECDDKSQDYSLEVPTKRESRTTYVSVPTWIVYELLKE